MARKLNHDYKGKLVSHMTYFLIIYYLFKFLESFLQPSLWLYEGPVFRGIPPSPQYLMWGPFLVGCWAQGIPFVFLDPSHQNLISQKSAG